jgi:hypothetical protein
MRSTEDTVAGDVDDAPLLLRVLAPQQVDDPVSLSVQHSATEHITVIHH